MKKSILLTSLSTIAACASVVAGATYALFTSESKVNVAVTSGTVEVVATASNFEVFSGQWNSAENKYDLVPTNSDYFTNGGYVDHSDGHSIKISGMSALDYVTFDINVENNSDIEIKYQTILSTVADTGLFDELDITLSIDGGTPFAYDGTTDASAWTTLAPGSDLSKISVKLGLPEDSNAQGLATSIEYAVYAVQANAHTEDMQNDVRYIYTARDLKAFRDEVNAGNNFNGKTVQLMADIDLNNENWQPIGYDMKTSTETPFKAGKLFNGTFDGNGYTIKNANVANNVRYGNGFFGAISYATIKNVTFDNIIVSRGEATGGNCYGIVTGYTSGECTFDNVHVVNSEVSAFAKIGGFVGHVSANHDLTFVDCSIKDSNFTGCYNVAGYVGLTSGGVNFTNSTVSNLSWTPFVSSYTTSRFADVDGVATDASGNKAYVYGTYWVYAETYLYAAWAELYCDHSLSQVEHYYDGLIVDGLTHNVNSYIPANTVEEVKTLIETGRDVSLEADVEVSEALQITKDIKIKGNGKKVTLTSGDRAFNVTGADVANVEISDITINVESNAIESRGVSFYNTKDVKATLNNVTIEGKAYYAVNVASLNENLNIEINDSTISGWSVFNLWSENTNVVVNNSKLTGINDKYNNAEYPHANDFAVMQFNNSGGFIAKDSKIELNDCEVNAVQGSDQWSAKEYHLIDKTNGLATFVSNNTTFKLNGVETSIIKG